MEQFAFTTAVEARAACDLAARDPRVRFLAGGTTLVDLMKLEIERPSHVVDINALPLATVEELADGTLRVGALVRNSDLAEHPLVRARYPVLAEALLSGASPQVRNMATTGGNLLQRTRCYYFRDIASACNRREPGTGCGAIDGYHRNHAVLGGSDRCIATHPSDLAVALTALDARVHVSRPAGTRALPLAELYSLPGAHPERETVMSSGELITHVEVPALPWAERSTYLKVRDRASFAFALASAAVALDLEGGRIREARIALGGVATVPWRATAAERALAGRAPRRDAYRAAAEAALEDAVGLRDNGFKIELAKRTLVRALEHAAELP